MITELNCPYCGQRITLYLVEKLWHSLPWQALSLTEKEHHECPRCTASIAIRQSVQIMDRPSALDKEQAALFVAQKVTK